MREILFRAKRIDNGEWVYGSLIQTTNPHKVENEVLATFIHQGPNISEAIKVDPTTVGQFIGIPDKNGKEIYEGDIVETNGSMSFNKYDSDKGAKREIFWMMSGFTGVRLGNEFDKENFSSAHNWSSYQLLNIRESLTVIGTIHDNPLTNGTK